MQRVLRKSRSACLIGLAPAASARRFYPDPLSRTEPNARLARYFLFGAVVTNDNGASRSTVGAAGQAVWTTRSAVGKQRDLGIVQNLDLTHDPVPAMVQT